MRETGPGAAGPRLESKNQKMAEGQQNTFSNGNPFDNSFKTDSGAVGPLLDPKKLEMEEDPKSTFFKLEFFRKIDQNKIWSCRIPSEHEQLENGWESQNAALKIKSIR